MAFTWVVNQTNWDLSISNGNFDIVSGADEVKQRILITLFHYWQEYFLNVPAGMPWYELILGNKNKKIVEILIRNAILNVPGVISILRISILSSTDNMRDFVMYIDVIVTGGIAVSIFSPVPQYQPAITIDPDVTDDDI